MKILVVAAHPDDEVLGCGGTITRLSNEGHGVYIAILGEGITSRFKKREQAKRSLIELLHSQSKKVARLLGAKNLFLYNLPDNRFDTIPLLDIIKIIEDLIQKIKPEVIYTHFAGDLNIDHQLVNRAVITATRPLKDSTVKEIYAFEIPSSTEWTFGSLGQVFRANVFVDISKFLDIKLKAMSFYKSEMNDFPHPRSTKALTVVAQRWGSICGCEAAEAFELIRMIK